MIEMVSEFLDYYVHLFTSLILYTTQRNEITTTSISSSNGLSRPITPTATTRLPASTVSQPAVMPTICDVIRWPPYMAWKRSTMTKYGVQLIRRSSRDITWRPGLRCSQAWRQCLFSAHSTLPRTNHFWPTSVTGSLCEYHAICSMDGKATRCLQIASLHVPI